MKVELLISEVYKRRELWDRWSENYNKKQHMEKAWAEVSAILRTKERDAAKLKWRNLRDQFKKELQKAQQIITDSGFVIQYSGKWIYFNSLLFLKDNFMCHTNEKAVTVNQNLDLDEVVVKDEPVLLESKCGSNNGTDEENEDNGNIFNTLEEPMMGSNKDKRPCDTADGSSKRVRTEEKVHEEIDDDLHFVKSLVPYLRQLNPIRKLMVRNEINSLLIRELSRPNHES